MPSSVVFTADSLPFYFVYLFSLALYKLYSELCNTSILLMVHSFFNLSKHLSVLLVTLGVLALATLAVK